VVLARAGLELVGAVDLDSERVGQRIATLVGGDSDSPVVVNSNFVETLENSGAEVVLLSTTSSFSEIRPLLSIALQASACVVSTCEELSFPWDRPGAQELDAEAIAAGRAILGTGVNPGFVMDYLPAVLTLPCTAIRSVKISRVVDLKRRRPALQRKAGVGLSHTAFLEAASRGAIGHIGLDCSARLLAMALGMEDAPLPEVHLQPLIDEGGVVFGFEQQVDVRTTVATIEMVLTMSMALEGEECDRIVIDGDPPVTVEIEGGLFGDTATAGMVVNSIPTILRAPGGLKTMLDLPPIGYWSELP
jgi:4-hydroxy-tetrahydrodipicolinate reductase